jgi:hypothetical protein
MARNALPILISAAICILAHAQDPQDDPRKPDQLVRALELKRSDAVAVLEIVLYNVLHGIDHRSELYPKLHRALRIGGRVVNIDLSAELPEPQVVREFTTAKFHITKIVAFLPLQYFEVFE